jgi:hypothetical protein
VSLHRFRAPLHYVNSNGLDEYIVDKCYSQAASPEVHIPITTFMIANDPYFAKICQ